MENKNRQPVGSLKISKDVISTIASVAALEIEGVDSLVAPAGKVGRLFSRSGGRDVIYITLSDDFAEIDLSVNLKYGAKITEVCPAIQNNVKETVQTMTGMAVSKVNVTVAGIAFPSAEDAE